MQFSDEDFEEDGAAHLRLENNIPTFASVQVAYPVTSASSDQKSADPSSSSSSSAAGKAQREAGAAAQGEAGIEMGANSFTRGTPSNESASHETQVIGKPTFVQPEGCADSTPTEAPADPTKAEP